MRFESYINERRIGGIAMDQGHSIDMRGADSWSPRPSVSRGGGGLSRVVSKPELEASVAGTR